MNKKLFLGLLLAGMTTLSACVSATGNPDLNNQARDLRLSKNFKADLKAADRQLQACIIYSFLLQEERGLVPRESIVKFACEKQELNYRAAVMSGVRSEWQSKVSVLNNTANTSTANVYRKTIESLKK